MSLLSSFAAILVATNTPAPNPVAVQIELAGKLARAKTPTAAERACAIDWERDSDGWHSCVVGLESWRCEVQGWCSGGPQIAGPGGVMSLPDPAWAGSIDWDAI